jgi:hypothetical protein
MRMRSIALLLDLRCPAYIAGLIIAVIVRPAIQRVGGTWPRADVRQECGEILTPCVTHSNSASPISREFFVSWILTALLSFSPRIVFRAFTEFARGGLYPSVSMRASKSARHRGRYFSMQTSARFHLVRVGSSIESQRSEIAWPLRHNCAANTTTPIFSTRQLFDDCQAFVYKANRQTHGLSIPLAQIVD